MFFPLADVSPSNPLMGGHGWLDKTDGGATFHPGLDLNAGAGANADRFFDVFAAAPGIVQFSGFDAVGFGWHLWIKHPNGHLTHYCHLQAQGIPPVGTWVERGQHIGECGGSGGNFLCHLHFEVLADNPEDGWEQWPFRWPRARVEKAYLEPFEWLANVAPQVAVMLPEEDEMALTQEEREALEMLRALSWNRGSIELAIGKLGRAAEIGRTIKATKKIPRAIKPLAEELEVIAN